jgi:hypothetical protein
MRIVAAVADRGRESSRSLWLIPFALAACDAARPANAQPAATSSAVASTAPTSDTAPLISLAPSAAPAPTASTPPPAPAALSTALPAPDPPAACGRKTGDRIERVPWPHGSGNAKCDALETLWANVPHADRAPRPNESECACAASVDPRLHVEGRELVVEEIAEICFAALLAIPSRSASRRHGPRS